VPHEDVGHAYYGEGTSVPKVYRLNTWSKFWSVPFIIPQLMFAQYREYPQNIAHDIFTNSQQAISAVAYFFSKNP
jgi:hypothetical protein